MNCRAVAFLGLVALVACARGPGTENMVKTGAPGHVAAGGRTSGEVMASTARPEVTSKGPSGTPGIPAGAEGNVGGTAPGGSPGQQEPSVPPAPPMPVRSEKAGTAPPSEDVKTGVQKVPPGVGSEAPNKAPESR